jgi:hypothetical protein
MNIYLIKRKVYPFHEWDVYTGFVIVANNPQEAQELAKDVDVNFNTYKFSTRKIGTTNLYKHPRILLEDYH